MAESGQVNQIKRNLLQRQRISAQRGLREPTRPDRYRRGKVSNSGANLQAPRPDPTAGIDESANAKLIGQMKEFVFGKGMVLDQYGEAETERGIASWEKADAETRESYAEAIKNEWIDSKESPFFREAVTNAYTDNMTHNASIKLFTDYEKWEDKNDPASGKLNEFFQQQEDEISAQMESIPDEILQKRFYEQWQLQKRELTRRHGNYLNSEYKAKSVDEIGNKFYNMFAQNEDMLGATFKDNKTSFNEILSNQALTEADFQEAHDMLSSVEKTGPNQGKLPKTVMKVLEQKARVQGGIWELMYNGLSDKPLVIDIPDKRQFTTQPSDFNIKSITLEEKVEVADSINSEGNKRQFTTHPRDFSIENYLYEVNSKSAPVSNEKTAVENHKELAKIITVSPDKIALNQKALLQEELKVKTAEIVTVWTQKGNKANSGVATKKLMKQDSNTSFGGKTEDGDEGIVSANGGAVSTLPRFLGSADKKDYSESVKAFAKLFTEGGIDQGSENYKLWVSYLDDKYSSDKGIANIWQIRPKKSGGDGKEKWITGDWSNAQFNMNDFMAYIQEKKK